MIGALIGALGSIAQGAIGSAASSHAANQANRFTKEMMYLKHNWDRQAVADNRAYNDPKQVMARLKAAGLNPDMMYGQGAGSLQNAAITAPASSPTGQMQDTSWVNNLNSITASLDAKLKAAQIKNVEEDTNKKKTEQANDTARVDLEERGVVVSENVSKAEILKMNQEVKNLEQNVKESDAKIEQMAEQNKLTKEQAVSEIFNRLMADKEYQRNLIRDNEEFIRWAHLNDLSDAQKAEILTLLPLHAQGLAVGILKDKKEIVKLLHENDNLAMMTDRMRIENGMLQFDAEHQNGDRNWKHVSMFCGMVRDVGIGIGGIVSAIGKFKMPAKLGNKTVFDIGED